MSDSFPSTPRPRRHDFPYYRRAWWRWVGVGGLGLAALALVGPWLGGRWELGRAWAATAAVAGLLGGWGWWAGSRLVARLEERRRGLSRARGQLCRGSRALCALRLARGRARQLGNAWASVELAWRCLDQAGPAEREAAAAELARGRLALAELDRLLTPPVGQTLPQALDLNRLVRRLLEGLGQEFHPADLEVELDLAPDLPPVLADPEELELVLTNLLLNALDAMGARGRLRVETRLGEGGVQLHVADSGPGLDPRWLRILAAAGDGAAEPAPGGGLGLWASRAALAAWGGGLRATNSPLGGARFTVALPPAPGLH